MSTTIWNRWKSSGERTPELLLMKYTLDGKKRPLAERKSLASSARDYYVSAITPILRDNTGKRLVAWFIMQHGVRHEIVCMMAPEPAPECCVVLKTLLLCQPDGVPSFGVSTNNMHWTEYTDYAKMKFEITFRERAGISWNKRDDKVHRSASWTWINPRASVTEYSARELAILEPLFSSKYWREFTHEL